MSEKTIQLLERRLKREKNARKQAEHFLETKSRELYESNEKLQQLAESQEEQIQKRTEELVIARDKALSGNRAKTAFLATMSHEIRTPMNGIIGMTHLLMETELSSGQHRQLAVLRSSAESLLHIINDILDLSKLESGKYELQPKAFKLHVLLDDILNSLAITAAQKNLELLCIVKIAPNRIKPNTTTDLELIGDPIRLRQILINLLGNAIKFTESGYILLEISHLDEPSSDQNLNLSFKIIDTGAGITKQAQKKLFKPFSQIGSYDHDKHQQQGSGLGLSISKKLTDLMGGTIGVKSKKDQGSTFWLELPFLARVASTKHSGIPTNRLSKPLPSQVPTIEQIALYQPLTSIRDITRQQMQSFANSLANNNASSNASSSNVDDYVKSAEDIETFLKWSSTAKAQQLFVIDTEHLANFELELLLQHLKRPASCTKKWLFLLSINNANSKLSHFIETNPCHSLVKPISHIKFNQALSKSHLEKTVDTASKAETPLVKKHKVLLVEDNRVNQMVAKSLLQKQGAEVTIAKDGIEAIECYAENTFNLILMDINMPRMGGIEATSELYSIMDKQGNKRVPIVALTANAMQGAKEEYLKHGMVDYLTKPIEIPKLKQVLEKWVLDIPKT